MNKWNEWLFGGREEEKRGEEEKKAVHGFPGSSTVWKEYTS